MNLTALLVLSTMFIGISASLPLTSYMKMVEVWLIFNLFIPFLEVLLHTYMDNLRDDGDREINHHGTLLPAEEKKDVSEKNELFKPSKKKMDLISRNEKIQVEALRQRYKDVMVKEKNKLKLQRLKFFSFYIIPAILTLFTLIYFFIGIMHAELNP